MIYPLNAHRLPGAQLDAGEITVNQTGPDLHELSVSWRRQTSNIDNYYATQYGAMMGYMLGPVTEECKSGT